MRPEIRSFVDQRISVEESRTAFALFALLNAAGYDDENAGEMHPVRVRVRVRLRQRLAPLGAGDVVAAARALYGRGRRSVSTHPYAVVAFATDGPPSFRPSPAWAEIASARPYARLAGLPDLLRAFFALAPLEELYQQVRPAYLAAIGEWVDVTRREVGRVLHYCRVSSVDELSHEARRAVVLPNLLDSYERALSFVLDNVLYAVEGPQRAAGYNPHEFVHAITNRLSFDPRFAPAQARLLARDRPRSVHGARSRQQFLDESLVRAICLRYLASDPRREAALERALAEDERAGHAAERFFYEALRDRFERSSMSLEEWYAETLERRS